MSYNPEIGNKMEEAARTAFLELEETLEGLNPDERAGAELVINYFKNNYQSAGYKKLARKLVYNNVDA
jgi:hypothetical protein